MLPFVAHCGQSTATWDQWYTRGRCKGCWGLLLLVSCGSRVSPFLPPRPWPAPYRSPQDSTKAMQTASS
ncbi:hypothetical protein AKJ09_08471 [Labilithrix luteola]|uniref:Uncharacterized protein n=1 Tax=Labilithrix luteola TaxID=1391654 RepID=A0A0K1Q7T4_9BACT|nr:hypothetical protein AKJ09_08471 [Labilithrix luteola]